MPIEQAGNLLRREASVAGFIGHDGKVRACFTLFHAACSLQLNLAVQTTFC